jgi:hypothetical protein
MLDNVVFEKIDAGSPFHPIIIRRTDTNKTIHLTKYGQYSIDEDYKCVIFPKGKTTWDGFVPPCTFNSGDILHIDCTDEDDVEQHEYFFILDEICNNKIYSYCHYYIRDGLHPRKAYLADNKHPIRFATEEEKQKLFDAIKANGYKWNEENKTLEKLFEPKFKVGDKIKIKQLSNPRHFIIKTIESDRYILNNNQFIRFEDEHLYELGHDKFDITTLKPFESRVLMRDIYSQVWKPAIYGFKEFSLYVAVGGNSYVNCIPYEGNEHLLGKTDDCDDFYKTWE